MIRACQFVQGNYIGGLIAPNDNGVCFSLSIAWLAEKKDAGYISTLKSANAIQTIYNNGNDKRTIIQASANGLGDVPPSSTPNAVIGVVTTQYGNVNGINPIPLAQSNFPAAAATFTAAAQDNVFAWMVNTAAGGRGHVVAWRRAVRLFFDANFGVYVNASAADIANHLNANYLAQYNVYHVVSFAA
ncbi:hypothetical protein [uncultured Desulfosarcina sp.]|uniref:hypothetical protein n=1 Tax=uncultured Desulfosarcina sp. TaxID=218289 RepID=UPI0029C7C4CA|nr:hypothetical protein [uncultured Desulfosarcina sp.]